MADPTARTSNGLTRGREHNVPLGEVKSTQAGRYNVTGFDIGSSDVQKPGIPQGLQRVADDYKANRDQLQTIVIRGSASDSGKPGRGHEYYEQERASAIKSYLVQQGINPSNIRTERAPYVETHNQRGSKAEMRGATVEFIPTGDTRAIGDRGTRAQTVQAPAVDSPRQGGIPRSVRAPGNDARGLVHDRSSGQARPAFAKPISPEAPVPRNGFTARNRLSKNPSPVELSQFFRRAAQALEPVGFGRSVGWGTPERGKEAAFDQEFWDLKQDRVRDEAWLRLRTNPGGQWTQGHTPADAVEAVFERPDQWSFDCGEFVQILQLSALLATLGRDQFNQRMRRYRDFDFKSEESTGLNIVRQQVEEKGILSDHDRPGRSPKQRPVDSLQSVLGAATIGDEVIFQNPTAPTSNAFRDEHTIMIGPATFVANGFGREKIYSLDEVRAKIAAGTGDVISSVRLRAINSFSRH